MISWPDPGGFAPRRVGGVCKSLPICGVLQRPVQGVTRRCRVPLRPVCVQSEVSHQDLHLRILC